MDLSNRAVKADLPLTIKIKVEKGSYVTDFQVPKKGSFSVQSHRKSSSYTNYLKSLSVFKM